MKVSKNFTQSQAREIWERQGWRCAGGCGFRFGPDGFPVPHHKKPKSQLSLKEIEEAGPEWYLLVGVGLCPECHDRVHRGDPLMARFRTHKGQKIGETELDLPYHLKWCESYKRSGFGPCTCDLERRMKAREEYDEGGEGLD